MKIEIFDTHAFNRLHDGERIQFIIDTLGSLDQFETAYYLYEYNHFPNDIVDLIKLNGLSILPITKIDDHIVKQSQYPSDSDLSLYTGISFEVMSEDDYEHRRGCSCGHCH